MVEGTRANFQVIGKEQDVFEKTTLTADAGFHTAANMRMLFEANIDGYVADILFRKRDPRFADAGRYKPANDSKPDPWRLFQPSDFIYDKAYPYLHLPGEQTPLQKRSALCGQWLSGGEVPGR
jgi:hypothetical protein